MILQLTKINHTRKKVLRRDVIEAMFALELRNDSSAANDKNTNVFLLTSLFELNGETFTPFLGRLLLYIGCDPTTSYHSLILRWIENTVITVRFYSRWILWARFHVVCPPQNFIQCVYGPTPIRKSPHVRGY
ncbi:hypothetical protein ABKN59_006945 [Abortiporus biennis]